MKNFSQVVGQKDIIEYFKTSIRTGNISHAYIIHGEDGMGKKTLTKLFAKAILCNSHKEDACDQCVSCLQINNNNHPDVKYITSEKASIGVDEIRSQLNQTIQLKPYSSEKKIYICENADKMTEAAQNSLLKTLEEPPEYAVILLLVDNLETMLSTILSRCIILDLKPVNIEEIKEFLMKDFKCPDYLAEIAANFSGGNIGKAIKYATSNEFDEMKRSLLNFVSSIRELEIFEIVDFMKSSMTSKEKLPDFLDFLTMWFRDVLLYKATNDFNMLLFKEEYQQIMMQASYVSYQGIEECINAIETAKKRLLANVNFDIAIELMLLRIKENYNG